MSALRVERAVLAFQRQVRGVPPPGELIVLDGKAPSHTGGQQVLTAVTVPGQLYLGSEMVADKSNEIPAARWLERNRQHWGIENGLHARLDVSRRDDQCRLKSRNAVWVHGILARLANSLFMEWHHQQPKPAHKSATDFTAFMAADRARRLLFVVTSRHPSLRPPS